MKQPKSICQKRNFLKQTDTEMRKYFVEKVHSGNQFLVDTIKLILYKNNPTIFDEIDFENDTIYQDPFVFAALNTSQKFDVMDVLWGYKTIELQQDSIAIFTDLSGRCYLPNIGYFYTDQIEKNLSISFEKDSYRLKDDKQQVINFNFEFPFLIHDTFQVLKHQHPLLIEHFYAADGQLVDVEISEITNKHIGHLTLAFDLIRDYSPDFYKLLKMCVRKVLIFKSEPHEFLNSEVVDRNSFATLSVHGCAFFNAFREEYNEVFFIEDIAHQCGHVIFNTYLASKPDIFKIESTTNIASPLEVELYNEERSLYVVTHAMYTYDSIFTCFSNCLENNVFEGDKFHEILGRLAFSCYKFTQDYKLLSQLDAEGNSLFFKDEGKSLLIQFLGTYNAVIERWGHKLNDLNLSDQPYNFSYRIFTENNPI